MATHYIEGRAKGRVPTGPSMPQNDSSTHLIHGRGVARPCPDRPSMPSQSVSGHLIAGKGWWRAPCVEATPGTACSCCGITDTFTRTVAGGSGGAGDWGTSDAAIPWGSAAGTGTAYTDGSKGVIEITSGTQAIGMRFWLAAPSVRLLTQLTGAVSATGDGWSVAVNKEAGGFASVLLFADGTVKLYTDNAGNDTASIADASVPLWVLIETDGTNATAKVWADGDAEPGSPTLSHPFNTPGFSYYTNDLNISAFSDGAAVTMTVDNVDIEGIDTCVFDNFQREVEEGWGFSTPTNVEWFYEGTPYVTDGEGVLTSDFDVVYTEIDVAVTPDPAVLDMRFDFRFDDYPTTGTRAIIAAPGSAARLEIHLAPQGSGDSYLDLLFIGTPSGLLTVPVPALDAGAVFGAWRCHIYTDLTQLKVRVWRVEDDEPTTWMGTVSTPVPTYNPNPEYLYFTIDDTFDAHIQNIRIDTDCFFDDFEREESGTWGTASPSGFEWTVSGSPSVTTGVADGAGFVDTVNGVGAVHRIEDDTGPWANADGWTMTARLRCETLPTGASARTQFYFEVYGPGFVPAALLIIQISDTPDPTGNALFELIDDSDEWVGYADFTAGGWFLVRWERRPGGVSRARIWQDGETEPTTWHVTTTAPVDPVDTLDVSLDNNSGADAKLEVDYIRFELCPAEEVAEG